MQMDQDQAASGGPALRRAWEEMRVRPTDLARALGVSPRAVRKWAEPGASTPLARVVALATQLSEYTRTRARAPYDLLALITAAAGRGRGLTVTELRRTRRANVEELLAELRDGALPLVHVREVVTTDETGRRYLREELHPGAAETAPVDVRELTGPLVRGLRLFVGWTQEGMANRLGCRRQQLHAWETGREQIPVGRRAVLTEKLAAAAADVNLRARRESADIKQAELARRAGIRNSLLWRAEQGMGRLLSLPEFASIGYVLDRARRDAVAELTAAVDHLVALVAVQEPDGLTHAQLDRARGVGRKQQAGYADQDAKVMAAAIAGHRLMWRETAVLSAHGRYRTAERLHLVKGPAETGERMSREELAERLSTAGVSASELSRALGVSWGAVSKWLLGVRPMPAPWAPKIRAALATLAEQPRRDPAADLVEAVNTHPGLPCWRLLQAAGYGKSNSVASAALNQLVADGQLHLEPRPYNSTVVLPGPPPAGQLGRLPGPELRERRQAAGLRQRDIAAATGVSQTAVTQWEAHGVPAERRADLDRALAYPQLTAAHS